MRNLTFTLFFLSFFFNVQAQEDMGTLKTTHEGHVIIENANFTGQLFVNGSMLLRECSFPHIATIQYNGNTNNRELLLVNPIIYVHTSNFIPHQVGFSKIGVIGYNRTYFPNMVSSANLIICKYSHRDGSITPILTPFSTISEPYYHNKIHLIDFPNGDWGVVGRYKNGDFSFSGMTSPFIENTGEYKTFVLRFDGATNQVVWQKEIAVSTDLEPYTDSHGNLYLFGERLSSDSVTIGVLTLVDTSVTVTNNFYIAKINPQGLPILLKDILKTDNPIEPAFHLRDSAYYIVSQIDGQVSFDSSTVLNGDYSFIAKYNTSNDSLDWLRNASISIKNSVLDFQGNIYFTGGSSNINWTLDSILFYNELQFFGKINGAGMTTAVTFDTISNVNIFGAISNRTQLVVNSENKVYMLVGKMEYADRLLLIEINPICEIEIIEDFEYSACYISTEEENATASVKIAPNPATDFIDIIIEDDNLLEDVFYRLYNTNGQLLRAEKISHLTARIYIQDLPSGLFFIEIITPNGSVTKKVMKL